MVRFAFTVFVSAFLLFQVQPVIARYILPWYGGTPAVWTTCMLFFQAGLLAGYAYAHLIRLRLPERWQAIVHLALLAVALASLPITPSDAWKPTGPENALLGIIKLLTVTVGVPYLLLSASGPLLQHWFAVTETGRSPYRLYALSNLGSLLGLVTYPFVIEPQLGLTAQTSSWSVTYVVYALACAACALPLLRRSPDRHPAKKPGDTMEQAVADAPGPWAKLQWLVFAACGSIMLLATTNQMCQDVAVIPFLWVLPLSLYLLSFIICFDRDRWYDRRVWIPFFIVALAATIYVLQTRESGPGLHITVEISVYAAALFAACMICHGELVRRRPPAVYLTSFYLMIALGGALGGAFVNFAAPRLFDGFWELHVGLIGTFLILGLNVVRPVKVWILPLRAWRVLWAAGVIAAELLLIDNVHAHHVNVIAKSRNFYGILRVERMNVGGPFEAYTMLHGSISHGSQYLNEKFRDKLTTYYGEGTGPWFALNYHPKRATAPDSARGGNGLDVGVVGLGTGTIARLGHPGDTVRMYEINPDVIRFAREYFTHLDDSPAEVDVILGDGRISLERDLAGGLDASMDVLVVDAFSSDAIPVHLLTREAFQLYWRILRPDGLLVVHVTNHHLDLSPVVRGLAAEFDKEAVWLVTSDDPDWDLWGSDWYILTSNDAFLQQEPLRRAESKHVGAQPDPIVWTDDYSNLLRVLK